MRRSSSFAIAISSLLALAACTDCFSHNAFVMEQTTARGTVKRQVKQAFYTICYNGNASADEILRLAEDRCQETKRHAQIRRPTSFVCPVTNPTGVLVRCFEEDEDQEEGESGAKPPIPAPSGHRGHGAH